jgi:hypothetical protein
MEKRDLAGENFKVVITDTVVSNRIVKNTIFLFLGNNTNIDRIMPSKVPNDSVLTVVTVVAVSEISSKIFLYSKSVLERRCTDRRSENMLTKPMILIDVS